MMIHPIVAENTRLRKLICEIGKNAPTNSQCRWFHHKLKDRLHGMDCPCVERWEKTLQKVMQVINER